MLPAFTFSLPACFVTVFTRGRNQVFGSARLGYWLTHYLYDFQESAHFELHGWCIMPDHVHILFTPCAEEGRSFQDSACLMVKRFCAASGNFLRHYTKHTNKKFWDDNFDQKHIPEEPLFWSFLSGIFYDPVYHGFVSDPVDYSFSSYHHFLHRQGTAMAELLRARYARQAHPLHVKEFLA